MAADPSIKIRTIPRPNEKVPPPQAKKPAPESKLRQWWLPLSMGAAILAIGMAAFIKSNKSFSPRTTKTAATKPLNPPIARNGASLPNLRDARMTELMLKRRVELENQRTMGLRGSDEVLALSDEDERNLGVQLDHENTSERIYEDLYGDRPTYADGSPEERINNKLANRKWVNEQEREARMAFVKNFIREAYDKGYEVELDQNLVVIGYKRIGPRKVTIDEVLKRLAKQGQ